MTPPQKKTETAQDQCAELRAELAAQQLELDDARTQIAELSQQLDAMNAGLRPVDGADGNWVDPDGNFVTPGLIAYEEQQHQAQVEGWERETGRSAAEFEQVDA